MSHYILIHGAWEESRAWDDISTALRQHGHTALALDLPGHGRNEKAIEQVTMAGYVDVVVNVINQLDAPVILVGHSMTGAVISLVAEQIPDKIERLIYIAAFLLEDGGTVMEAMQSDPGNELLPEIVFSDDQTYATVAEKTLRRVGFYDVDESVIRRVLPLMAEQQATQPFLARVELSDVNFGSVPKTYIRTTIDKITSTGLQDRMIGHWDVETVFDLHSGHFPAFSVPQALANLLLEPASAARLDRTSNG